MIYYMATTISISNDMKTKLKNIGRAGDSYEDIIRRMYEIARKKILFAYLYDTSDTITIDEAITQAKEKWRK